MIDRLFSLDGSVAVVVGGSGVLGSGFCHVLSGAGAAVAVVGRNLAAAERVAVGIREEGGQAVAFRCDVTQPEEVEACAHAIEAQWGTIDILVNAPGVNSATPFFELTQTEWRQILDVNLTGVMLCCQCFGRAMVRHGGGSIINISSASSEIPLSRVSAYSASKAGVDSLTRWLARELAPHRIRVNALAPGFFPAEQNRRILSAERVAQILAHTPAGRLGQPGDLDGALVWLASERASGFVTGAVIRVDGGFTAMTI